jgi:hypothetical protein
MNKVSNAELGEYLIETGDKVMNMCVSLKINQDSQGNVTEYRARFNTDRRQQEEGTYGDTFTPTSKFSCVHPTLTANEGLPTLTHLMLLLSEEFFDILLGLDRWVLLTEDPAKMKI